MRRWVFFAALALAAAPAAAQTIPAARVAILQAENRRAPTAHDLLVIRNGTRSPNSDTARIAVRALGRLERPALMPSILPSLRHRMPEVRAEAANAIAQAALGTSSGRSASAASIVSAERTLIARLGIEAEPSVRAALLEAIARLPYRAAADVERAETAIVDAAGRNATITDRLGAAKALEALVRLHKAVRPPGDAAIAALRTLLLGPPDDPDRDPLRDARVRRLALAALIAAGAVDAAVIERSALDPDPQVRRLAVHAAIVSGRATAVVDEALRDSAVMVRLEAIEGLRALQAPNRCAAAVKLASDAELPVAVAALDQLASCESSPDAILALEGAATDMAAARAPRGWHRAGRALVALAAAAPDRAAAVLDGFVSSDVPQLRMAAARAAGRLRASDALQTLSRDEDEMVADAARAALGQADPAAPAIPPLDAELTAANLRRLAAPRARITIRDVGVIDLALFTAEAPATVLRFAALAESGYFNGLPFSRLVPNSLVQVGSPGDRPPGGPLRDEVGLWPHVRGAAGIASRGRDAGGAEIFLDLVDNPQFDHEYTVFAQVLNGIDLIDQVLEGDVIERVDILP